MTSRSDGQTPAASASTNANAYDDFEPARPVADAYTLPARYYIDPELLRHEQLAVFESSWQPFAQLGQLTDVGQYVCGRLQDERIVATRDTDGQLQAFFNVCRHHAAQVTDGCGRAEQFVCPYHGWTYALDGRLKKAPALGAVTGFAREDFGLRKVRTAAYGPYLWVCLDDGAPAIGDAFAGVANHLPEKELQGLVHVGARAYWIECNWKVFVDNYLDGGYHVSHVHPELAGGLALNGYETHLLERASVQTCAAKGSERLGNVARYAFVYPNIMLNRYGPILDVNVVTPIGVDRCRVDFDFFVEADKAQDAEFVEQCVAESERVQEEDMGICADVQGGLKSRAYDVGRYAVPQEAAMHDFHCTLVKDLRGR